MSDLSVDFHLASAAFAGKIPWSTVQNTVESQAANIIKADPTAAAFVNTSVTVVKQKLSDAIGAADGYLGKNQAAIAAATEAGLDTALAAVTGGKSLAVNGFVNAGIDQLVAAAITAAQAWGLKLQAALVPANVSNLTAAPATPAPGAPGS